MIKTYKRCKIFSIQKIKVMSSLSHSKGYIFLLLVNIIALFGSFANNEYFLLNKPWFAPPLYLFVLLCVVQSVSIFRSHNELKSISENSTTLLGDKGYIVLWVAYISGFSLFFTTSLHFLLVLISTTFVAIGTWIVLNLHALNYKISRKLSPFFVISIYFLFIGLYIWSNN